MAWAISVAAYGDTVGLTTVGDPVPGNSWVQTFNESGVGNYDFLAVVWQSGNGFEAPTFSAFTVGGWAVSLENAPIGAIATGPDTTNMNFNLKFAGSPATPLAFDFYAFDGDTLKEAAHASWTGSTWVIGAGSPLTKDQVIAAASVPLPAAAWAGMVLIGGLGARRAMRRAD
ncbi:hypothetical protein [Fontivita pretiosa]|uniref:hypothetical protein n=1 Tax=Fontivita pretiosa TaxID=2989684 RepID=UPI003D176597